MKIKIDAGAAVWAWLYLWYWLDGDIPGILFMMAISFVATFIVNPRWSLSEGWRFKP